jgi:hypothetical protein
LKIRVTFKNLPFNLITPVDKLLGAACAIFGTKFVANIGRSFPIVLDCNTKDLGSLEGDHRSVGNRLG